MTDDFVQPSSATGVEWATLKGSLLAFEVLSVEDHVPTVHTVAGEKSPAVKANVYVIDGPTAGEDHYGVLVFPKVLQGQLSGAVGRKVLGRLGQRPATPGKNAAWELASATAEDMAAARAWSARQSMTSAAPASTPPF